MPLQIVTIRIIPEQITMPADTVQPMQWKFELRNLNNTFNVTELRDEAYTVIRLKADTYILRTSRVDNTNKTIGPVITDNFVIDADPAEPKTLSFKR